MADGQIVFEISTDGRRAIADVREITDAIRRETSRWDDSVDSSTNNMTASMSKAFDINRIKGWGIEIAQALVEFGKEAVQVASDLQEVQNVVDTTFGENASRIDAWSKKAGTQFGLTELQAKKFTSTLGAMMKSAGMSGDSIVNISTNLSGLAADMASFYNLDFETAFEKIRSGISGETEPLKQLGINMSVANLEAFALTKGISKAFDEMSQAEQTMLRYQYMMQATADAQGDFARTSDGYANTIRRMETAFETIKEKGGQLLLTVIEPLATSFAGFLANVTSQTDRTVLDDLADIDNDLSSQMADLNETYAKAEAVINSLEEIEAKIVTLKDGSVISLSELFGDLSQVEKSGGDIEAYLTNLGVDVEYVVHQYKLWQEHTKTLTSLIPSLASAIDEETGAIDGGTEALKDNLDQWRANEEKKLVWAAYYAKERALIEKKASLYSLEVDALTAKQRVKKAQDALKNIYGVEFDPNNHDYVMENPTFDDDESRAQYDADIEHYVLLLIDLAEAEEELAKQDGAYTEAEQILADTKQALIDKFGEEEAAAKGMAVSNGTYLGRAEKDWIKLANAAESSVKALTDYYQQVRNATEQSVNSVINGFANASGAGKDAREKSSELASEEVETLQKYDAEFRKWKDGSGTVDIQKMGNNWDKLTDKEKEAYNALVEIKNAQNEVNKELNQYKPQGMQANLTSQIEFMQNYLKNLQTLREWGISDELLASLSDGSAESAEYLAGLASDKEGAKAVDALYKEVQGQKKTFVDTLTEQKLAVDETYDALVKKAEDTIDELFLGQQASDATGDIIKGMADGIKNNVSNVATAVDAVLAELNRLSGWGVNLGPSGSSGNRINISGSAAAGTIAGIGQFETGLDFVPYTGFLASLHEGEGILTAEENRVWQMFKNGSASNRNVDYDALGDTMRTNVKAGGDVYLDGRVVGHVISQQQANSYRNLQRSGWQG